VLGGALGRVDHLLGELLLLLAAERYAGVRVDAQLGAAAVHVVRGEQTERVAEMVNALTEAGYEVVVPHDCVSCRWNPRSSLDGCIQKPWEARGQASRGFESGRRSVRVNCDGR
jgi:hypothetical protein